MQEPLAEVRKQQSKKSDRLDAADKDESRTLGAHADVDDRTPMKRTKTHKDVAMYVNVSDTEEDFRPGDPVALDVSSTGIVSARKIILETDVLVTVVANPNGLHSGNQPLIYLCPDGFLEEIVLIPVVFFGHVLVRLGCGFVVENDEVFHGNRVVGEVMTPKVIESYSSSTFCGSLTCLINNL